MYSWPETRVGTNASVKCANSETLIYRECYANKTWGSFDDDNCGDLDDSLEMLLNQTVSIT